MNRKKNKNNARKNAHARIGAANNFHFWFGRRTISGSVDNDANNKTQTWLVGWVGWWVRWFVCLFAVLCDRARVYFVLPLGGPVS